MCVEDRGLGSRRPPRPCGRGCAPRPSRRPRRPRRDLGEPAPSAAGSPGPDRRRGRRPRAADGTRPARSPHRGTPAAARPRRAAVRPQEARRRRKAGRRRMPRAVGRRAEVPESVPGQLEQALDGPPRVWPAGRHLDDVALLDAERGHPREAPGGHRLAAAGDVAEPDVGLEPPHRPDQDAPRAGRAARAARSPERPRSQLGRRRRRSRADRRIGGVRASGGDQVRLLGPRGARPPRRPPRRGRHRRPRPPPPRTSPSTSGAGQSMTRLPQRRRRAGRGRARPRARRCRGPSARRRPPPVVRRSIASAIADGVGAERAVVEPRGHLDAHRPSPCSISPASATAASARARLWETTTRPTRRALAASGPRRSAGAAAAISSAAEVAPGSWCPTLRSPR